MSTNRSHLVPTTVLNKNGVVTTVHKKPDNALTQPTAFPPVSLPAEHDDFEDVLRLVLLVPTSASAITPHFRGLLEEVRDNDPDSITLAARLLTTGSSAAQERAANSLFEALANMRTARDIYGDKGANETWRERNCARSWSPEIKHDMVGAWHLSQMIEETGQTFESDEMDGLERRLRSTDPRPTNFGRNTDDYSRDDSHWRGLAVLTLTDLQFDYTQKEEIIKFLPWAGNHEHPDQIIDLASERGTFERDTLTTLLTTQENTAPALRQGTL